MAAPRALEVGSELDSWLLEECLGRGGMGIVFRATHRESRLLAAIKIFTVEAGREGERIARQHREARTLARLDHPSIVRIFQEQLDHDPPYIVMEYLPGGSLAARIHKVHEVNRGAFTKPELLNLATQLVSALEAIHGQRVLHRDIKPANVLFGSDGCAKLADFGIAKPLDLTSITLEDQVLGTLPYMSPETLLGKSADVHSELYQLGALLYHTTAGCLPFTSDQIRAMMCGAPRPALLALPPRALAGGSWLMPVLDRLMATASSAHFQAASEVAGALAKAAAGTAVSRPGRPSSTTPASLVPGARQTAPPPSGGRSWTPAPLHLLAGIGLVLGCAMFLGARRSSNPPAVAAPIPAAAADPAQAASSSLEVLRLEAQRLGSELSARGDGGEDAQIVGRFATIASRGEAIVAGSIPGLTLLTPDADSNAAPTTVLSLFDLVMMCRFKAQESLLSQNRGRGSSVGARERAFNALEKLDLQNSQMADRLSSSLREHLRNGGGPEWEAAMICLGALSRHTKRGPDLKRLANDVSARAARCLPALAAMPTSLERRLRFMNSVPRALELLGMTRKAAQILQDTQAAIWPAALSRPWRKALGGGANQLGPSRLVMLVALELHRLRFAGDLSPLQEGIRQAKQTEAEALRDLGAWLEASWPCRLRDASRAVSPCRDAAEADGEREACQLLREIDGLEDVNMVRARQPPRPPELR